MGPFFTALARLFFRRATAAAAGFFRRSGGRHHGGIGFGGCFIKALFAFTAAFLFSVLGLAHGGLSLIVYGTKPIMRQSSLE